MITNTTRYASLNRIKEENCVGYTQDTCLSQRICRKKLRSYVKSVEGGVGEQTHKFLYHIQELNSKDCQPHNTWIVITWMIPTQKFCFRTKNSLKNVVSSHRRHFGLSQQQTAVKVNRENKILRKQISCMTTFSFCNNKLCKSIHQQQFIIITINLVHRILKKHTAFQ